MKSYVVRFLKDESGATAIEYGLIAALIAVAIIGGARALGTQHRRHVQQRQQRHQVRRQAIVEALSAHCRSNRLRDRPPGGRRSRARCGSRSARDRRMRAGGCSPDGSARRCRFRGGDGHLHDEDPEPHLGRPGAGVLPSGIPGRARSLGRGCVTSVRAPLMLLVGVWPVCLRLVRRRRCQADGGGRRCGSASMRCPSIFYPSPWPAG